MVLALQLEDHERPGCISLFGVLGKFDVEAVELGHREQFRYPELIMNLRKHKKILGQHVRVQLSIVVVERKFGRSYSSFLLGGGCETSPLLEGGVSGYPPSTEPPRWVTSAIPGVVS